MIQYLYFIINVCNDVRRSRFAVLEGKAEERKLRTDSAGGAETLSSNWQTPKYLAWGPIFRQLVQKGAEHEHCTPTEYVVKALADVPHVALMKIVLPDLDIKVPTRQDESVVPPSAGLDGMKFVMTPFLGGPMNRGVSHAFNFDDLSEDLTVLERRDYWDLSELERISLMNEQMLTLLETFADKSPTIIGLQFVTGSAAVGNQVDTVFCSQCCIFEFRESFPNIRTFYELSAS